MQVTIYIPKKYEADFEEAKKAAEEETETGGIGAYLMGVYKELNSQDIIKYLNQLKGAALSSASYGDSAMDLDLLRKRVEELTDHILNELVNKESKKAKK